MEKTIKKYKEHVANMKAILEAHRFFFMEYAHKNGAMEIARAWLNSLKWDTSTYTRETWKHLKKLDAYETVLHDMGFDYSETYKEVDMNYDKCIEYLNSKDEKDEFITLLEVLNVKRNLNLR